VVQLQQQQKMHYLCKWFFSCHFDWKREKDVLLLEVGLYHKSILLMRGMVRGVTMDVGKISTLILKTLI